MNKKLFLLLTILVLALIFVGCKDKSIIENTVNSEENLKENNIVFDEKFINLSNMSADELIEYFKDNADNYDIKIEKSSNGLVEMKLSDTELDYWKKFVLDKLEQYDKEFSDGNRKILSKYSDDYTQIDCYFDKTVDNTKAIKYFGNITIYCAMYQYFMGSNTYLLNLNVYNSDTQKLISGGNLEKTNILLNDENWKESYKLSDDEINSVINNKQTDLDVVIDSKLVDSITLIDMYENADDNTEYVYIDQNDKLHIGMSKENLYSAKQNITDYFNELILQFEQMGNGYDITYNQEYNKLDLCFDKNLDEQNQSDYFAYSIGMCTILQALDSQNTNCYIDISITNAENGEIISTGNSNDGIEWNMGG